MIETLNFAMIGLRLLGLVLHLWTVFILFQLHGLIGSVISFFAPVLSEIYLVYISWKISGVFLTNYNSVVLLYIFSWIIWITLILVVSVIENKINA